MQFLSLKSSYTFLILGNCEFRLTGFSCQTDLSLWYLILRNSVRLLEKMCWKYWEIFICCTLFLDKKKTINQITGNMGLWKKNKILLLNLYLVTNLQLYITLTCPTRPPKWLSSKEFTCQETRIRSVGREDPLEKEMATHSGILAWKIP